MPPPASSTVPVVAPESQSTLTSTECMDTLSEAPRSPPLSVAAVAAAPSSPQDSHADDSYCALCRRCQMRKKLERRLAAKKGPPYNDQPTLPPAIATSASALVSSSQSATHSHAQHVVQDNRSIDELLHYIGESETEPTKSGKKTRRKRATGARKQRTNANANANANANTDINGATTARRNAHIISATKATSSMPVATHASNIVVRTKETNVHGNGQHTLTHLGANVHESDDTLMQDVSCSIVDGVQSCHNKMRAHGVSTAGAMNNAHAVYGSESPISEDVEFSGAGETSGKRDSRAQLRELSNDSRLSDDDDDDDDDVEEEDDDEDEDELDEEEDDLEEREILEMSQEEQEAIDREVEEFRRRLESAHSDRPLVTGSSR